MDLTSTANLVAAGLTAVAAGFAWLAARGSKLASEAVSHIEAQRWHAELTPQFHVTLEHRTGTGVDQPLLTVRLIGPVGLGRIDELAVRVRDEFSRGASQIAGGPTVQQVAEQIWGPFRFSPRIDGTDATGRHPGSIALEMDEFRPFQMERTRAPAWYGGGQAQWEVDYSADKPLRLRLHCVSDGHEPWDVPLEVHASLSAQV